MLKKTLLTLSCLSLVVCGCSRTTPSSFYVLNDMAPKTQRIRTQPLDLGIGPITLPKYLNTPQIVTRKHNHQLQLDEFHRWAEPLHDNIKRVLGDNLLALLPSSRVINYPWQRSVHIDTQVQVDIRRFEMDEHDDCILVAHWSLFEGKDHKTLLIRDKTYRIARCTTQDYRQIARLMSRNLLALSQDIARDIRRHR